MDAEEAVQNTNWRSAMWQARLSWIFTSESRVEYRTRKGHLLRHSASSPHSLQKNQQENITEFLVMED